jgi:CDP-diacylglycerol--glycerol-3-phosphate 3-phosphatidyltransferase
MSDALPDWKKKLPLQLTYTRIYLVPFIVACLWQRELGWSVLAATLFMLASITDYYDGYFARKFNAVSNMGKFMDPVADKILVTSILAYLIPLGVVDPYMVIIIITRDTFIGGIRSAAAADGIVIDAKTGGKWKTAMQMVAIPAVMIAPWPQPLEIIVKIGYGLLWVSVILSITSGIGYYLAYRSSRKVRL